MTFYIAHFWLVPLIFSIGGFIFIMSRSSDSGNFPGLDLVFLFPAGIIWVLFCWLVYFVWLSIQHS